jgi:CHASE3 domain sensor protein
MSQHWTFGQKVGAGFAITVALAIAMGAIAIYALRSVVESKDRVITVHGENIIDAGKLALAHVSKVAAVRGFLLDKNQSNLEEMDRWREEIRRLGESLHARIRDDAGRSLLGRIDSAEREHQEAAVAVIAMRNANETVEAVSRAFDERMMPKRKIIVEVMEEFVAHEQRSRDAAKQAATDAASSAISTVALIAAAMVGCAVLVAWVLTSALSRQIGTVVGQVQSSSAELQAAANQQATGSKEQSTAMNEITTTISELLATSRQIAESAQRVASVAEQTAGAARSGDNTVQKASDSLVGIRRQVDLVVNHMLELGKKSQQIGAVLEIVSELAEQTNILAINATIEAVGAGETGRRFAVVADEIRKLADRVGGSTKEIRGLIEDVRGAVNTTVMATEAGSKAVDAGNREFAEVASSFKDIAGLVSTTTEASREIELSTQQQATAVEQVNVAIANVAQATRETEASSGQTLQTASQLASLSKELLRLVKPQGA